MREYISAMKMGYLESVAHPKAVLWSGLIFLVILSIFIKLWRTLYYDSNSMSIQLTFEEVAVYFVTSQVILMCLVHKSDEISHEIREGNISYRLFRPIGYLSCHFFDMLGKFGFKACYFFILGMVYLIVFFSLPKFDLINTIKFISCFGLGVIMDYFIRSIIGVLTFFLDDIQALNWIYNKLLILLGGAIAPLDIFPISIQKINNYLPFKHIIYVPTKLLIGAANEKFSDTIRIQLCWLVLCWFISTILLKYGKKKLVIQGG